MDATPDRWASVRRFLDERLQRGHVRFLCLAMLFAGVAGLAVMFATSNGGQTAFGPQLGADFAGFYNAGRILNLPTADAQRLYDWSFQDQMYHELLPNLDPGSVNPYVHPPLIAFIFRLFALLPYDAALVEWLVISAGFYVGGFLLLWGALPHLPRQDRLDGLLIALAFEPFLMETWVGGQLSGFAFFLLAAALFFEQTRRPFASGLVLGVLLYKPTLLVLLLPLLLVARRWRTLAGVAVTGLVMAALSLLLVGEAICRDYVHVLLGFTGTTTGGGLVRKEWKWVDLNFFLRLLLGGPSRVQSILLIVLALPPLAWLVRAWWRFDDREDGARTLLWAGSITATMVLNLYIGIYDTILIVAGILLTANVLCGQAGELPAGFRYLLLLLFATAWVYQPLALATGVQVYTLVLIALAVYQLSPSALPTACRVRCADQAPAKT